MFWENNDYIDRVDEVTMQTTI